MRRCKPVFVIAVSLVLLAVAAVAMAADLGSLSRKRQGRYEFTLQPRYVASKTIDGTKGTSIDLDQDLGFGFGIGYNVTNKLALGFDWNWSTRNYRAKIATTDSAGNITGFTDVGGTLDTGTIGMNLSYYFLDGPVTPFATGGIGWTFVDSNIPSGPPVGSCWWDPWYGYVCTSYQNTYSKDYFSYNLGVGVRWDVSPGFFLRGSVGWQWLDLGGLGTQDFAGGRLDLGFMY